MRFPIGNSFIASFSSKFRLQPAKKVKTKRFYTPPLGDKKRRVFLPSKKNLLQASGVRDQRRKEKGTVGNEKSKHEAKNKRDGQRLCIACRKSGVSKERDPSTLWCAHEIF